MMKQIVNFIEYDNIDQANNVNLEEYTFVGLRHNNYVFKLRVRK